MVRTCASVACLLCYPRHKCSASCSKCAEHVTVRCQCVMLARLQAAVSQSLLGLEDAESTWQHIRLFEKVVWQVTLSG